MFRFLHGSWRVLSHIDESPSERIPILENVISTFLTARQLQTTSTGSIFPRLSKCHIRIRLLPPSSPPPLCFSCFSLHLLSSRLAHIAIDSFCLVFASSTRAR